MEIMNLGTLKKYLITIFFQMPHPWVLISKLNLSISL